MSSCLSAVIVGATRQQLRSFGPAIERAGYRLAIVQTLEDIPTLHDVHQIALLVYTNTIDHEDILSVCQILPRQPDLLILHDDWAQPDIGFAPYQRDTYDSKMIEQILSNHARHHQTEPAHTIRDSQILAPETSLASDKNITHPAPDTIEHADSYTAPSDETIAPPTPDTVESKEINNESTQTPDTRGNLPTSATIQNDAAATPTEERPISSSEAHTYSPYSIHPPTTNAVQTPYHHIPASKTLSEHKPQQSEPVAQPTHPAKQSGTIIALIPIIGILVIASIVGIFVGYRQFIKPKQELTTDSTMQTTKPQVTKLETHGTNHTSSSNAQSNAATTVPKIDLTAEIVGIYPDKPTVGEVINIQIRIHNKGTHPITEPFWVDLYVSPRQQPSVNDSWHTISSYGATWLVEELGANEAILLETLDADTSRSNLLRFSAPGPQTIQVLVDSYGKETIGAIVEYNEENNLSEMVDIHIAPGNTPEAEHTF